MSFPPLSQVLIVWFSIFWLVAGGLWFLGQFTWYNELTFLIRVFVLATCVVWTASYMVIPGLKLILKKLKS